MILNTLFVLKILSHYELLPDCKSGGHHLQNGFQLITKQHSAYIIHNDRQPIVCDTNAFLTSLQKTQESLQLRLFK